MTFEIGVGGRTRVVSIERVGATDADGGRFRVVLHDLANGTAGETLEIDARRTDLGVSLIDLGDGRSIDAAVTDVALGECLIQLRDVSVSALVDERRSRRQSAGPVAGHGAQRVTAPMPGRVVRLLVKPGDEVRARQGVIVIEAMKMENELAAPRDGVVKEVAVSEGQSVEAGRLLIRLE